MNISTILWSAWTYTYMTFLGLFLLSAFLFLIIVIIQLNRISDAPPDISWVGLKDRRLFPKLRACLGEFTAGRSRVDEGYDKYGKHNLPFVIPGMNWNGVVLPPSNSAWLARQPESILSGDKVLDDTLGFEYLTHGPSADSCRDFTVIRRDLTRQIVKLTDQILDEISSSLDDELGFDSEWKDVKLTNIIDTVSFRTTNRIFVGLPQCRSKGYRNAVTWWTTTYGLSIVFLRAIVPTPLKRFTMPVLAIPTKLTEWWATSHFIPAIKKRLKKSDASGWEKGEGEDNDMMQWIINENAQKLNPEYMKPANIGGKMLLFNLFATGTTSLLLNSLLFRLLSHENAATILDELREEADTIMPDVSGDPRVVRNMIKTDSLVRETLRCEPLSAQVMFREVVKPGGVETPDGIYLPQGAHVQAVSSTMQVDKGVYGEGAADFEPFRWVNQDESGEKMFAVKIGEDFLSFGLGRHACPGRFFAVHVIKLVLGCLLMHYDIEPMKEQPKFAEIGEARVPSSKTLVKVRRRKNIGGISAESQA